MAETTAHDLLRSELPKAIAAAINTATDAVLLPYQTAWVADDSDLKVAEKSRRIGLTWAEASDNVLIAAKAKQAGGMNVYYIGYNMDMAIEYIEACAMWARIFNEVASEVEEGEEVFKDGDDEKAIKTYTIRFASGFRIVALSSLSRPNFRSPSDPAPACRPLLAAASPRSSTCSFDARTTGVSLLFSACSRRVTTGSVMAADRSVDVGRHSQGVTHPEAQQRPELLDRSFAGGRAALLGAVLGRIDRAVVDPHHLGAVAQDQDAEGDLLQGLGATRRAGAHVGLAADAVGRGEVELADDLVLEGGARDAGSGLVVHRCGSYALGSL